MHVLIEHGNSDNPKEHAMKHVKAFLAERFEGVSYTMKQCTNPQEFELVCDMFLGLGGFAVEAYFDHLHGDGEFQKRYNGAVDIVVIIES